MNKIKKYIKSKFRSWLFQDYKWITRAEVQQHIGAIKYKYRDNSFALKVLTQLQENIK